MTASGFRVQVTGLVFVFSLASLVLKQVPTCTQKPKTNTFDLIRYKKKLKDVDISCLLSDDDIQGRKDITTGSQNDIGGRLVQKKKNFCITESLSMLQISVWFSQREECRGSDFLFLGLQWYHPYEGVARFMCD